MESEISYKPSQQELEMCQKLISKAKTAFSDPSQSGYYVRTAGITENGDIVTGGNKENSLSDAYVHGETAVISHIRDVYGKVPIKAIGFYKDGDVDQLTISPCGACRDVLIQQTSPDLLLVAGNKDNIVVSKLKNFTFENFKPIEGQEFTKGRAVDNALIALNQGVDAYLPQDLKRKLYGVAIVDQMGRNYRGSLYTNAGYDAITPGLAAVQTFINSNIDHRVDINQIVFVSKNNIPSPFYRDRVALSELCDITRLSTNRQSSIEVQLIQMDESDNISKVSVTNTDEWVPYPFSARSFGMDEVIERQYAKMFNK